MERTGRHPYQRRPGGPSGRLRLLCVPHVGMGALCGKMVNEGSGSWRDQDWKGNPITRDTLKLLGLFGVSDFLRKSSYPPTPKLLSVKGALALCHAAMVRQMQDRYDDFIMIDRRAIDSPQPHRDVNPKKRKPLVYRAGVKRPF